jgi:hypothetical protein
MTPVMSAALARLTDSQIARGSTLSCFQPGREVLVGKGYGSQVDVCRSVGVTTG